MKKIGRLVKTIETSPENPRKGEGSFIKLKDGAIMLAFSRFGGQGGDHDYSRLVCILSCDEGETWSEERALFDDDLDCRNNMAAALVRLPNGELGLCYLRKSTLPDGRIACMPVFRYSGDEGKTWSGYVACTERPGYYCGTNAASIVTKAGRLITPLSDAGAPVHRYDLAPGVVRFMCSDDNGRSWREAMSPIESPYGDRGGLQEPGILELPDGTLFCHMRTTYGFQYQSVSSDGGRTWSAPEPALQFPSPDSPMRITDIGGRVLAVFNPVTHSPASEALTPWGSPWRSPLMLAVSGDGCSFVRRARDFSFDAFRAFSKRCYLIEDDLSDCYCYPAMIGTTDGCLITYYCDGGSGRVLNCSRVVKVSNAELDGEG
ncbi:MAG: exo-alpha-sialidase [Clostridia bacterium]|nr:exo-alpha-sialidase [Clostridia bacterium]